MSARYGPVRPLRAWICLASRSFPVPLSPVTRTVAFTGATFLTLVIRSSIARLR